MRSVIPFVIVLLIVNAPIVMATEQPVSHAQAAAEGAHSVTRQWDYGGFVDLGYLFDVTDSTPKTFRSRGTAWHLNEFELNMAGAYVKTKPSPSSRIGAELVLHAGQDDAIFGFSATAPNLPGHEWLRHVGAANVSYLVPLGQGVTVQGGIFTSLIGYDSLYAKDNANYTRPWGADFTPYLMMGVNASYPITGNITGTMYVVNGYWHLANANHVPSIGGQIAYKMTPRLTLKEAVLWGPHQQNTASQFWRFLSDTILEHRIDRLVLALNANFVSENVDVPARSRAWWAAAQVPVKWTIHPAWTIAIRPEIAWDSTGRWTLAEQTVKAITNTVEYRFDHRATSARVRVEHRFDDSSGPGGGFFDGDQMRPDAPRLKRRQQLLIIAMILTLDSRF